MKAVPDRLALFTDLYEVTMAKAYLADGMNGEAVFELFYRKLPAGRSYAIAAGIPDALACLETFRFHDDEIDYLRSLGTFDDGFLETLAGIRFTGDVWAVPEGTAVFGNEPILQVVAPIVEAQLVEPLLLNRIHLHTVIASKAARVVRAAAGRAVVEFGMRRTHGFDAAMALARDSWIAGAAGTSNLAAGRRWGLPVFGTMAHSFVQAHEREADAFTSFARCFPGTTILVDTYDTLEGVRQVVELVRSGYEIGAIRLDSGDLATLSRACRAILDDAGLRSIRIIASGDLDEATIAELVAGGAPIDGFGVGTRMGVSSDAPTLDLSYKLVAFGGRGRAKLSTRKVLYPGRKQIFRRTEGGRLAGDVIGRFDEALDGEPLLVPVMEQGVVLPAGREDLRAARERVAAELDRLPPAFHRLDGEPPEPPVSMSQGLEADLAALRREHGLA